MGFLHEKDSGSQKIKEKVVKKLETKKAGNMVLDYKSYEKYAKKDVQKMIGKAEHSLKVLKERQKNHTNMIKELEEKTVEDILERGKNRWGTFSICLTMKYCEDRLMDAVKSTPPADCMNEQSERMIKQIVAE